MDKQKDKKSNIGYKNQDIESKKANIESKNQDSNKATIANQDSNKAIKDLDSNKATKDLDSNKATKDLDSNKAIKDLDSNKATKDLDSNKAIKDLDSNKAIKDLDSNKATIAEGFSNTPPPFAEGGLGGGSHNKAISGSQTQNQDSEDKILPLINLSKKIQEEKKQLIIQLESYITLTTQDIKALLKTLPANIKNNNNVFIRYIENLNKDFLFIDKPLFKFASQHAFLHEILYFLESNNISNLEDIKENINTIQEGINDLKVIYEKDSEIKRKIIHYRLKEELENNDSKETKDKEIENNDLKDKETKEIKDKKANHKLKTIF